MNASADLVNRLWRLCAVLRKDGITYQQYVTELTYLLFLKMASEQKDESRIPEQYRWGALKAASETVVLQRYRQALIDLGDITKVNDRSVVAIFQNAATIVREPANLRKLIDAIDALHWFSEERDAFGDTYEGLLQKMAEETERGAGQYFTPRVLIDVMVDLMQPQPGEVIQDPAAGTGGLPKASRTRLDRAVKDRRFASRLPEPQQEQMVFGFEEVRFHPAGAGRHQEPVDYVALSDGEHQQALILGIFAMIAEHNALFILDEPESHFNPQWRVQFVKRLLDLPGVRGDQEVLLTSHAPFVPADISREQVLIFARSEGTIEVSSPEIETFGANFDRILEHCFEVRPPISQMARDEIKELLESDDVEALTAGMDRLGASVEKSFLADRLRQLKLKAGG